MQASKSQIRAAKVLGIAVDPINDEYADVAARLAATWMPEDGIPSGHTWRSAAKLSDDELVKLLKSELDVLALPRTPDRY